MKRGMWEGRVFLVTWKKINFRIEFKTKFGNECSLDWGGDGGDESDLIPSLDANSFFVFPFKK